MGINLHICYSFCFNCCCCCCTCCCCPCPNRSRCDAYSIKIYLSCPCSSAAVLEAELRRTGQPQVRRSQLSKSDHIYHSMRRTSGCRHHCFSQMIREACVHYQHTIYNHRMVNLFSKSRTHFVGRSVVHRQQDQTPHVFIGRYNRLQRIDFEIVLFESNLKLRVSI